MRAIIILIAASAFHYFISGCNASEPAGLQYYSRLHEMPVITGIRYTYFGDQDGAQGILLGNPSYPMPGSKYPRINVFPNPYYAFNPEEPSLTERFVTFTRLPEKVTIEIYRGLAPGEEPPPLAILAGSIFFDVTQPIAILEKDNPSQWLHWYLQSPDGSFIPSGLYRAYIVTKDDGLINWVDIYILNSLDCKSWRDPTGWLGENWLRRRQERCR